MYAKKSLGQNFLKSERALAKIVESGNIMGSDVVLEIGPGMGALTERLLTTGAGIIAVEKDDNLFALLQEKFAKEITIGKLVLIHDDILSFDFENWKPASQASGLKIKNYKLIANIPYNITGAILRKFLSDTQQPALMVLLVQKEVAQRIVSADGKGSILSNSVQAYGEPRYVETVKAGSFAPAPKVDSAIIAIENISKNFFSGFSEDEFFKLLQAGFQSKRKKLSSNLSKIIEKKKVQQAFIELGLSDNTRGEELDIKSWKGLAKILLDSGKGI